MEILIIVAVIVGVPLLISLVKSILRPPLAPDPYESPRAQPPRSDLPPMLPRGGTVNVLHESDYFDRLAQIPGARVGARKFVITDVATLMWVPEEEGDDAGYVGVVFGGTQVGDLGKGDARAVADYLEAHHPGQYQLRAAASLEGGWNVGGDPWFRVTLDAQLPARRRAG